MSDADALTQARFTLLAEPYPGLLPRLLQPFAKRGLVPDLFEMRREGDRLLVEITCSAMPAAIVHLVAGNLAQVIGVTELQAAVGLRQAA